MRFGFLFLIAFSLTWENLSWCENQQKTATRDCSKLNNRRTDNVPWWDISGPWMDCRTWIGNRQASPAIKLTDAYLELEKKYTNGPWKVQTVNIMSSSSKNSNQKEWSILIPTLPERKNSFEKLVNKLKKQIIALGLEDRIEVLYFLDTRGYLPTGFKRNKLLEESKGVYVCFIDDDDDIHEKYISMIYEKLQTSPDAVSLMGIMTWDGKKPKKFVQSIKYDCFSRRLDSRPPCHTNPMKREIAIQFAFPLQKRDEDVPWIMALANSHKIQVEAQINEPYYFWVYVSNKK